MKKLMIAALASLFLASCINPRKFEDLNTSFTKNKGHLRDCRDSTQFLLEENTALKVGYESNEKRISRLTADSTEMNLVYNKQKKLYDDLNSLYEQLLKRTENENQKNLGSLKEMEASLMEREKKLHAQEEAMVKKDAANKALQADLQNKQNELERNEKELAEKVNRVKELELKIALKDSLSNALKKTISDALTGFSDNDLTVTLRDGKVYVSLSEQLLFASGSTVVDKKGKDAIVQLGKVLQNKSDINILIEGHTDDVPLSGHNRFRSNWDLSGARAGAVADYLSERGGVPRERLMVRGMADTKPVAANDTREGRAKNRRIEILVDAFGT